MLHFANIRKVKCIVLTQPCLSLNEIHFRCNDKCGNHFSALKPISIKFFVSIHRIQCHFCFLLTAPQKESSPAKIPKLITSDVGFSHLRRTLNFNTWFSYFPDIEFCLHNHKTNNISYLTRREREKVWCETNHWPQWQYLRAFGFWANV